MSRRTDRRTARTPEAAAALIAALRRRLSGWPYETASDLGYHGWIVDGWGVAVSLAWPLTVNVSGLSGPRMVIRDIDPELLVTVLDGLGVPGPLTSSPTTAPETS